MSFGHGENVDILMNRDTFSMFIAFKTIVLVIVLEDQK